MGAVLAPFALSQVACCCGSAACSLCCSACPSCSNSTSTRVMYSLMLVVAMVVCCIMMAPGLQNDLKKVPFCKDGSEINVMSEITGKVQLDCDGFIGYLAVYRVCFILTLFFVAMAVVMIGVRSSRDGRAPIQNGFWGIKYILVIGGVIGAFYIPESGFGQTWMYFGMVGGFLFILIQLVLIIDFADRWAENWVEKYEESESRGWCVALWGATVFQYIAAFTAVVLFYVYYTTTDGCHLNKFFISFNMILCLIISVLSLNRKVQEKLPRSGLLQASFVSLYVMYLTWSAMSNSPQCECKLNFSSLLNGDPSAKCDNKNFDSQSIVALVIWFLCVLWSSLRNSTSSQAASLGVGKVYTKDDGESGGAGGSDGQKVFDDEEEALSYPWSVFHVMFALSTLYVMMTLTNWFSPDSDLKSLSSNWASVWVKIVSSWICVALFCWSRIAPIVFPDREF